MLGRAAGAGLLESGVDPADSLIRGRPQGRDLAPSESRAPTFRSPSCSSIVSATPPTIRSSAASPPG